MNATIIIRILNTNAVLFSPRRIVIFVTSFLSATANSRSSKVENGKPGRSAVSRSPLVAGRVTVSIVGARIERDCKFISARRADGVGLSSEPTRSCFYSSYIFFSARLGSPLLFSSGPAVIIRHVTVIFFDVFIEFCVERVFRSEKCSFCVRPSWRVCVSSDVDVADGK